MAIEHHTDPHLKKSSISGRNSCDGGLADQGLTTRSMPESGSTLRRGMLAELSHEIRAPLGAILGFAELMAEPGLTHEERLEYYEIICRNGRQLLELTEGVEAEHPATADSPLAGLRILVAEDSIDSQILTERILIKAGAAVELASDGEEALLKARQGRYDVVLMDIRMPKLDGYEVIERLRKDGFRQPVIAVTAHAMKEERERCLKVGCDEHLAKPVSPFVLLQAISRLVRN